MNITNKYEIVSRPDIHFIYIEKRGPSFAEMAQIAWPEMFELVLKTIDRSHVREFLGLSGIPKDSNEDVMIYCAGLGVSEEPAQIPPGAHYRKIKAGKYAKFILTGSYAQIWPAFRQVFKILADSKIPLREEYCIENYVNDPATTPEEQLITELLVPIG